MRILVVNSNTTEAVTTRIAAAARAAASPGTEVTAVTAPFGLPLIVTRADWLAAGPATLAALAQHRRGYDAAKELLDVPVLGISEAAFHAACMLGRRFGVVSFTAALRPMFEECLAHHGLTARCAGFRMGPPFGGDPGTVAEDRLDLLAALCAESAEQDGAECIILAGGPLAGLAPVLQPRIAVPLVDGTQAAVRLAEAMAGLMPRHPRAHRARRLTGFAPEVAGLYAAR